MKLKTFGIFCLSFFMTTAMSSCESDEITDQLGEVSGSGNPTLTVLAEQMAGSEGYDEKGISATNLPSSQDIQSLFCGLKLNFSLSGITKIELESVDGYALAGTTGIQWGDSEEALTGEVENANSILVFNAPDENGLTPGKDYSILPCLATFMEAIACLSIGKASWHIILVCIKRWSWVHSSHPLT